MDNDFNSEFKKWNPTLNSQCHRSVVQPAVGLVLHLADDAYFSILHCWGVQCDATANTVGAIWIVNGHFGADTGELAYTCVDSVGAILDVPCHSQFLWIETCNVTLYGLLLPLCHCGLLWERHCRPSWERDQKQDIYVFYSLNSTTCINAPTHITQCR